MSAELMARLCSELYIEADGNENGAMDEWYTSHLSAN